MNHNPQQIAVIGAGNMGTTLANLLAKNGHSVSVWDINHQVLDEIETKKTNSQYLPRVRLDKRIKTETNIRNCITETALILVVVPSQYVRKTVRKFADSVNSHQILLNCAKGIEAKSLKFMSEVIEDELQERHYHIIADLSGPSLAKEVAAEKMTRVTIVSKNQYVLPKIRDLFEIGNEYFRVNQSVDTIGVQLGGMMKNIYALAVGICDGVDASYNTKAFLLDGALSEMTKLGTAMGAYRGTFYGLSGVGDLIATCFSENSRNRTLGNHIGRGLSYEQAAQKVSQATEGVPATKVIHKLAKQHKVYLPIAEQMYDVLFKNKSGKQAIQDIIHVVL
jgi:glycerol-3-phosphate dehydrogenase (NAD(P)+)